VTSEREEPVTTIIELGGVLDRRGLSLQIIPAMRPRRIDPGDPEAGWATVSLWHGGPAEAGAPLHSVKRAATTAEALAAAIEEAA
jgi:hypothetical protein